MSNSQNIDQVKAICDDLTKKLSQNSNFEGYQVLVFMRDHSLTRYANSVIHQPMSVKSIWANIKVSKGKKVISTRSTVNESIINSTISKLETTINKTAEITHFKGFGRTGTNKKVNATSKLWTVEERAEIVEQVVSVGSDHVGDALFFGKVETLGFHFAISNSNDIGNFHSITYNDFKVMGLVEKNGKIGYGREVQADRNTEKIDIEKLTISAAKIAKDTVQSVKLDPGDYKTILKPQAAAELARYTLFDLEASQFHQGDSAFTDRLGEQLFSTKLNISEEPYNREMIFASPVDSEGTERQTVNIIENGTPKHVFYDLSSANEFLDEDASNGYAVLPYSEYLWGGPDAMSMAIKPGNVSETEMIEDTKMGLMVQTLWYSNSVNSKQGIVTGLTRDGLYLIEGGEIKHAVKNLRYTDTYLSFFKNIDMIGKEVIQLVGDYNGSNIIPSIKLDKLKFVSGSK